jgi:transcriptional regulator with XRE-family HTH domain
VTWCDAVHGNRIAAVPDPLQTFTTNLRKRRRALGLTQEAVAFEAFMDQSQYSRIERGQVDPSIRTLTRVARALEASPSDLLRGIE